MSLIINHNISAMNTQRNMNRTERMLSKSLEKLSSGYKINVAADDPSGLIISEQLRSQINGLGRAIQNSQEASNVIGIAEGALIEMNEILRKMRSLALHAANSGITSPEQVAADQAEVDSGIQTIERIANTTRYSDQFLLNGSKGIVFDTNTVVDDTMDHGLLDVRNSRIDQVFKREGVALDVGFTGILSGDQADTSKQAKRAMFEADGANAASDITNNQLTAKQRFILTGSNGSRIFNFDAGTEVGSVASSINNVSDSTGVEAQLIFSSAVTPREMTQNWTAIRTAGDVEIYGAGLDTTAAGDDKVTAVNLNGSATGNINSRALVGKNLDGNGRAYARVTSRTAGPPDIVSYEFYKDSDMTMLIGTGGWDSVGGAAFTPTNNSGFLADDILINANFANIAVGDVFTLSFAGLETDGAAAPAINDNMDLTNFTMTNLNGGGVDINQGSVLTGVELGRNTDANGNLYFRATGAAADRTIQVYRDANMRAEDLVATGSANLSAAASIRLESVNLPDGTDSNLNITLTFQGAAADGLEETGQIKFNDLGIRLASSDYGSQEYVRVQNTEGNLWSYYRNGDDTTQTFVEVDTTVQEFGQDATISLNGSPLFTDGLSANVTTPDFAGALEFEGGELGQTTIAQAGYDVGSLFSRATALQTVAEPTATSTLATTFTYATNARAATTEVMDNFIGGMQYQVGAGEGDQERTVYGIPSMVGINMGVIEVDGVEYSLQDVLAGGTASLSKDPILALRVVTQAVDDVSTLRARLGAFQKNLLQTNINSLEVAVENITKTESAIRDANMATETTEFTKNQILSQAGTAMLAQANTASQNVLQLLG